MTRLRLMELHQLHVQMPLTPTSAAGVPAASPPATATAAALSGVNGRPLLLLLSPLAVALPAAAAVPAAPFFSLST
jgi:ribosomal protein L12E/L44/L45/RPP1/RPP2